MDIRTYAILLGLLSEAGLTTDSGTPDFDKIASITGHTRDTVKVYLAPGAEFPRWLKLMNYVGERFSEKWATLVKPDHGVGVILEERLQQITKHGRSVQQDVKYNADEQLSKAASILCYNHDNCLTTEDIIDEHCPEGWSSTIWAYMVNKPYQDRLIIAGALIAAELDRLKAIQGTKENTEVTC